MPMRCDADADADEMLMMMRWPLNGVVIMAAAVSNIYARVFALPSLML